MIEPQYKNKQNTKPQKTTAQTQKKQKPKNKKLGGW